MKDRTLDGKSVNQAVKSMRQTLERFVQEMHEALDSLELKLGNVPQGELHKRLRLLHEVFKKGGTVTSDELKDLTKKYKYGKIGAFFKGKKASLAYVVSDGEQKVALTQYGQQKLQEASLIRT